jgi:hypothetical protein
MDNCGVGVVVVVAAAAVYNFVAFGINGICEAPPFDTAARQPLNFAL